MKEKIYTIPVTEVFGEECECPMCLLEKRLEEEYVDYYLGPSLMEPDCRMDTNEKGFCRRHFEQLYNKQENRLGLGLMIDTHMQLKLDLLKKAYCCGNPEAKGRYGGQDGRGSRGNAISRLLAGKAAGRNSGAGSQAEKLLQLVKAMENSCSICDRLKFTMERYVDVIFHLWSREEDFKRTFESKKGFCLRHFSRLLEAAGKYLKTQEAQIFVDTLIVMQIENLERIQQEVSWFTKKFDYRNSDAPWGNSRDAVPRSIRKLKGICDLKQ